MLGVKLKDPITSFAMIVTCQIGVLEESPEQIPSLFITLPFHQRDISCHVKLTTKSHKRASYFHTFAHRYNEFILFVSARRDETYKINELNECET